MKKLTVLMTLSVLLFSGLLFAEVPIAKPIPVYTEEQTNIDATHQPVFIIKLKANATTGYEWFTDYNASLLKVSYKYDSSYDPTKINQRVGAPGYGVWTIKVIPQPITALSIVKSTEIHFSYKRDWEKGVDPIKTVTFTVVLPRPVSSDAQTNDVR